MLPTPGVSCPLSSAYGLGVGSAQGAWRSCLPVVYAIDDSLCLFSVAICYLAIRTAQPADQMKQTLKEKLAKTD